LINEGGDPAQLPPNAIQVTPEEKEAIERVLSLSFFFLFLIHDFSYLLKKIFFLINSWKD